MSKKTATTPEKVADIIALREAGYTALSIAQRLGVSIRTVQRHIAAHGAKKGALKATVIQQAREELLRAVTSNETIKEEAAKLIHDDLAHAHHLRELLIGASEHLHATSLKEAALVMRAAAAYSTAIKNTSDTIRHTLRIDQTVEDAEEEMPELLIRELTEAEIEEIRGEQYEAEMVL